MPNSPTFVLALTEEAKELSVPAGYIDPPEDLVEEGREAYLKWEESLGPLPEPEELEAEPCEVGILNDPEPPGDGL